MQRLYIRRLTGVAERSTWPGTRRLPAVVDCAGTGDPAVQPRADQVSIHAPAKTKQEALALDIGAGWYHLQALQRMCSTFRRPALPAVAGPGLGTADSNAMTSHAGRTKRPAGHCQMTQRRVSQRMMQGWTGYAALDRNLPACTTHATSHGCAMSNADADLQRALGGWCRMSSQNARGQRAEGGVHRRLVKIGVNE